MMASLSTLLHILLLNLTFVVPNGYNRIQLGHNNKFYSLYWLSIQCICSQPVLFQVCCTMRLCCCKAELMFPVFVTTSCLCYIMVHCFHIVSYMLHRNLLIWVRQTSIPISLSGKSKFYKVSCYNELKTGSCVMSCALNFPVHCVVSPAVSSIHAHSCVLPMVGHHGVMKSRAKVDSCALLFQGSIG